MAPAKDFDAVEIKPAHRLSDINREWYWGWVAIDREDGLAVGVVTTYRVYYYKVDGIRVPTYAGVMIVHARRYKGLGVHLLAHAHDALAEFRPPVILYRSGVATPKGRAACLVAGLQLDPQREAHMATARKRGQHEPRQTDTIEHALDLGRRHLVAAAQMLGVEPIPPKTGG